MAEGAVWSEPFSAGIAVNREKYRNFREFTLEPSGVNDRKLLNMLDLLLTSLKRLLDRTGNLFLDIKEWKSAIWEI